MRSTTLLAIAGPVSAIAQVTTVVTTITEIVSGPIQTIWVNVEGGGPPAPGAMPEDKVAVNNNPLPSTSSVPSIVAPPPVSTTSSSPSSQVSVSTPSGTLTPDGQQICIQFTGNEEFHWLSTGGWAGFSGKGTASASRCWDPVADTGIFFCENECDQAGDAAPAKYTKLECTFGDDFQNCDMSIVDGFSLPVECTLPGANPPKIGGLKDLDELAKCPSMVHNTCSNTQAYSDERSAVDAYFGNAEWGPGGNYCVWNKCGNYSDPVILGRPMITCEVGTRASSKSKRGVYVGRDLQDGLLGNPRHAHGVAHARGFNPIKFLA